MTRFSSRVLVGAALTVLLGSFAVVPAVAVDPVPAPPVTFVGGGITDGATYLYGKVPAAPTGCTTTAVGSDGLTLPCVVAGYLTTVGQHELVGMVGDPAVAGTPTVKYTVKTTLKGFYGPVKEKATWNSRKGGSTVPLKFKIIDADGVKAKSTAAVASFLATPIPCVNQTVAVGTKTIDFLSITKKGRTLRFHDGAFHQNWKTDKIKATKLIVPAKGHGKDKTKKVIIPSCYQVTMTAVDGQAITALFKLK